MAMSVLWWLEAVAKTDVGPNVQPRAEIPSQEHLPRERQHLDGSGSRGLRGRRGRRVVGSPEVQGYPRPFQQRGGSQRIVLAASKPSSSRMEASLMMSLQVGEPGESALE
jgi:hypothetical protein